MDNYVAIVFNSDQDAFEGLHALWRLDLRNDITVHAAAVIRRKEHGEYEVATKRVDEGIRTLAGAAIGALIGALGGPAGIAAGAGAGAIAGVTADTVEYGERDEAAYESGLVMKLGQAAVLAEVSEPSTTALDALAKEQRGTVYRRRKSDVRNASMFGDEYIDKMLPYDYDPQFARS